MKKLDLTGIATTYTAKAPSHPTIAPSSIMAALLKQFADVAPRARTLENQRKTLGAQLAPMIRESFFRKYDGIGAETSTLLAVTEAGTTVKLTTKNAYSTKVVDPSVIVSAIGQKLTDRYFTQKTVLKLDLEKLPEDLQEKLATGVLELAKSIGAMAAVSATQCIQPVTGFHEARTTALTLDQNLALDQVMPVTAYPQL